jgi:hypothetical protein
LRRQCQEDFQRVAVIPMQIEPLPVRFVFHRHIGDFILQAEGAHVFGHFVADVGCAESIVFIAAARPPSGGVC